MKELDRNTRINSELKRISVFFEEIDENDLAIISPLIQNYAFMKVVLDDLQELINQDGVVDHYQNGANQSGLKVSAALQSYNSLIKNFSATVKNLSYYLPPMTRNSFTASAWEDPEERQRREEEERQRIEDDFAQAAEYQQWQREQEAMGNKNPMSFTLWRGRKKDESI